MAAAHPAEDMPPPDEDDGMKMFWRAAVTYLVKTLPRDMKVALTVIASRRLQGCAVFLGLMALTVLVGLLAMGIATGGLPSMAVNTDYLGLAFRRLRAVTAREFPAAFLETVRIYLDYPLIWFTFERMEFEEQLRTLAMDTTAAFPVINLRYVIGHTPILLLLTCYLLLARYRAEGVRAGGHREATPLLAVSLPGGSGAVGSAMAPMACCGGTAIQSVASVMGAVATAPAVVLLSKASVVGVGALLVAGILRMARRIVSGCC